LFKQRGEKKKNDYYFQWGGYASRRGADLPLVFLSLREAEERCDDDEAILWSWLFLDCEK